MVRHKSRLEREKEAADAEKKASPEEAGSHGRRPKAAAQSSLPGEVSVQTVGASMAGVHISCYAPAAGVECSPACQQALGLTVYAHPAACRRAERAMLNAQAHSANTSCHACQQGLGDMKAHMSRLEKDRAAVAARKAAGVSSPAVDSRLPSYMRQTAASAAMQRVSLLTRVSGLRLTSVLWK